MQKLELKIELYYEGKLGPNSELILNKMKNEIPKFSLLKFGAKSRFQYQLQI